MLLIGDIIADKFVWGDVSRISPEAPVPVVRVTKETYLPGGAGNVAANISSLQGKVYLTGVVGKDAAGEFLQQDLVRRKANIDGVIIDSSRPTTLKTRIIAQHQQIVRIDHEVTEKISEKFSTQMLDYISEKVKEVNAIIISDYGKGVIKPLFLQKVISLAHKHNLPIIVDPKVEHFYYYRRVTCITPNLQEAILGMHYHNIDTDDELYALGHKILKKLRCKAVIITRGEKGMTVFDSAGKITNIPACAKEVFDVTGAGDTVVAVLSLALGCKTPLRIAAEIANYAAGIVVGKLGTATVSQEELCAVI